MINDVKFTLVESVDILTKSIKIVNGNLEKKHSVPLFKGTGQQISINSLSELTDILNNAKPNQCLLHGIFKSDFINIVTPAELNGQPNTYTRSKKYVSYPANNALCMIDYDPDGGNYFTYQEIIDKITNIIPGFKNIQKLVTWSTSACISNGNRIQYTNDESGNHIYFSVKDSSDIERFKDVLFVRSWLTGYGHIKISKAGSILIRSQLFDAAVFSPERVDFIAGAELGEGLQQNRPEPVFIDGFLSLDTKQITDLTNDERARYEQLISNAKDANKPKADRIKGEWIQTTAEKISKESNISLKEAREQVIKINETRRLSGDFLLYFDALGTVTVDEVLNDLSKFDKQSLKDPFEPEMGACKACFYANTDKENGTPVIHSQLHGGIDYTFSWVDIPGAFWYEIEVAEEYQIKINETQLYDFLKDLGFTHIKYAGTVQLVKIENNICKVMLNQDIRKAIRAYIKKLPFRVTEHCDNDQLTEVISKGINSYIQDKKNDFHFQTIEPEFVTDTSDTNYFFFANGFTQTTKDGCTLRKYEDLPGVIWESQIIKHVFEPVQNTDDFTFAKFTKCTCTNKLTGGLDIKRYAALKDTIGYLLHNYKTAYNSRAVIFSEASLDDEPQGRTGKGLINQAIGKLRKRLVIDGRNIKFDTAFVYQNMELDTQIILFDDVYAKFPFNRLFSTITEGISYERKNKDRVNLTPEQSPKIAITINYAMLGNSESDKGRKIEMELLCYFSSSYRPEHEFNERFFENWDSNAWNQFYSFMSPATPKCTKNSNQNVTTFFR